MSSPRPQQPASAGEGSGDAQIGVAVVGSANLDLVMRVPRFAEPGETLLGANLEELPGGKGLNQAVAAARRTRTALVGCVGSDAAADLLLRHLVGAGVEIGHVRSEAVQTGRAFIQVTPRGENSIVVLPLGNHELSAVDVVEALDALHPAVVLAQLEVPMDAVTSAAQWAGSNGARFLLNPSPIQRLRRELLAACDPLVVNAQEARALLQDADVSTIGTPPLLEVAQRLAALTRSVVVTDGASGAYVADSPNRAIHVPGRQVVAVDTTGAGDEFAGVLAAELSDGHSLLAATRTANEKAASLVALPRSERLPSPHERF